MLAVLLALVDDVRKLLFHSVSPFKFYNGETIRHFTTYFFRILQRVKMLILTPLI